MKEYKPKEPLQRLIENILSIHVRRDATDSLHKGPPKRGVIRDSAQKPSDVISSFEACWNS